VRKNSNPFKNRIIGVSAGFSVSILIIWFRVFKLQVVEHSAFIAKAKSQQLGKLHVHSRRGSIMDRNGKQLAVSVDMTSVWTNMANTYKYKTIKKIARILKEPARVTKKRLARKKAWVARKVFDYQAEKIKALKLDGAVFLTESRRIYPKRKLAGQLIGFLGIDNLGLGGVEYYYNSVLKGEEKTISFFRDGKSRRVFLAGPSGVGAGGSDLLLTIDEQIQYIAERALEKGCRKSKAKKGVAMVVNPRTNEILAIANYPSFNPNSFGHYKAGRRKNGGAVNSFEPGSTMKVFLASAALEEGLYSEDDVIDCLHGKIEVGRLIFKDHKKYGNLTFAQVIEHSSNVGAITIGMRLHPKRVYNYYKSFGFGKKTNVGLPGEAKGILRHFSKWMPSSIGAISIGQEMSVTAVQLASAISTIANKGMMFPAKIIKEVRGSSGVRALGDKQKNGIRIVSRKTAETVAKILVGVVESGTGREAAMQGYNVAGKTGTAQKYDMKIKSYSKTKHVASFIGFFPAYNPRLSIVVIVDEPRYPDIWGGTVAAPIFRNIGRQTAVYMNIPPDKAIYTEGS